MTKDAGAIILGALLALVDLIVVVLIILNVPAGR